MVGVALGVCGAEGGCVLVVLVCLRRSLVSVYIG